jgi:hypothetical protein
MNNENYEFLKEQVKMTGFGEGLEDQLHAQMSKGEGEFQLQHQHKYGEKEMYYTLNFAKSKTQDNYFLNSFDAILKSNEDVVTLNRFYADQRITAKEAFNLLEGRSVEKKYNHHEKLMDTGKEVYKPIKDSTYNVWVKMDFNDADEKGNFKLKRFGEKWGFDLEKKVVELPIRQLQDVDDRKDLLNSLKKGNIQSVTFEQNGQTENRYIEANPRARTINVYDDKMQLIEDKKLAKNIKTDQPEANQQGATHTDENNISAAKEDKGQVQGMVAGDNHTSKSELSENGSLADGGTKQADKKENKAVTATDETDKKSASKKMRNGIRA